MDPARSLKRVEADPDRQDPVQPHERRVDSEARQGELQGLGEETKVLERAQQAEVRRQADHQKPLSRPVAADLTEAPSDHVIDQ
jgi:hypothetical protein